MNSPNSGARYGWFLWAVLALVAWGVWALASKILGDAIPPDHAQALSTLGLLPILLFLRPKRTVVPTSRKGIGYAVAAGLLGCFGNIVYFAALNRGGQASVVIPLTALYPLLTVVLACVFLREKWSTMQVIGAGLSLIAIYLFNVESEGNFWVRGMGLALLPIFFWGLAGFLQKLTTNHLSGEEGTFWFLLAFVPVALVIVILHPLGTAISGKVWAWSGVVGFFLGLGNLALLISLARGGKASIVVPLTGLYPLVSVPLAIALLHEKISTRQMIAVGISLIAVIAISMEKAPPAANTPATS